MFSYNNNLINEVSYTKKILSNRRNPTKGMRIIVSEERRYICMRIWKSYVKLHKLFAR